ncbi:fur family transcriptional regulator FurA3 [Virgisporangium ochraceum]|uniref:Transcriptional repressor n=1 Tax=Virgisporangium ochraceum TaxID=65505 RepID=A0A8J4EH45_9ACTN|nr:Fur family transcriptional regulator [Virgisporangium ochraceum]GIJ74351.1 transcriptional repressor [Virgisporangium ochraceum]
MYGERLLRDRGLRVTRPRLAVLAVLTECQAHLDVEEITVRVRERLDSVSVQAVYDVLGALTAAGLARRIAPAGGAAHYEARVGDNHHHLVCRQCGGITDVDCATGAAPCLEPIDTAGFVVEEAEVTYWGVCATCRS